MEDVGADRRVLSGRRMLRRWKPDVERVVVVILDAGRAAYAHLSERP
jgi:hypothetical protein